METFQTRFTIPPYIITFIHINLSNITRTFIPWLKYENKTSCSCNRAYQSAEQNDLWDALTKQAHKDKVLDSAVTIKEIMDTWTLQTGFPVVTVIRDYNNGAATLTQVCWKIKRFKSKSDLLRSIFIHVHPYFPPPQERFMLRNGTMVTTSNVEPLWWIPITYTTESQLDFNTTQPSQWMKAEKSITLTNLNWNSSEWVIFNIQETGKMKTGITLHRLISDLD